MSRNGWTRNAIDQFVLARLEREGINPSPEADRALLLRRVTLDLTGLPPTLAELDDFLADPSSRVILHTSAEDAGRVAQAAGVKDAGALASTS